MLDHSRSDSSHNSGGEPSVQVSLVGSLPPVKGVSAYTAHLVEALSHENAVGLHFIGFRNIYPPWAYPGGQPEEAGAQVPSFSGVSVHNQLTWYNPLSWMGAGLTARGDVVHAQWWSFILAPVYAVILGLARLRGKRVLITVHNVAPHERGFARRLLNRLVFGFAHRFIVHSEQNRTALAAIVGESRSIDVLPHGVLDTPRTGITQAAARDELGLPPDAKVVLSFGNIRPYKGVDVLLRAFADVARAEPDAMLVIAGRPWTDWSPYGALIAELGITGRVRLFLEYIPTAEIERYFAAADVVALPYTHFDAQSGVGARALPFGKPLVVSNVGGLSELVDGPGAIVPPGDAPALAAAIVRVLSDAALRERMSRDSLAIAASLGWESIARRTISIYEDMASEKAKRRDERAVTGAAEAGRR